MNRPSQGCGKHVRKNSIKTGFVTGHDFSRADKLTKLTGLPAPAKLIRRKTEPSPSSIIDTSRSKPMHKGIQIGAKPDAGFDDPLAMLKDCHRRIEHFLNILCVVAPRVGTRALSGEETAAIQAALQYFRSGGQRHSADEEQSLFPRMRAADATAQFEEISGLEHDHREADEMHQRVDALYSAWIANGTLASAQHEELSTAARNLAQLYERHIALEEEVVFPRAAQLLSTDALAAMGEEFRVRRA
jgi:hemerythrin-like domain-containing protein